MSTLWVYANPHRFLRICAHIIPILLPLAIFLTIGALFWGFMFTPDDYRQGASVKIIFIHVPAAMMAINAWICMVVASVIWIIRRHVVSIFIARSAASVGVVFAILAIFSGALWGKPIWGTYWAWDPRLTFFAILFFFYLGYLGLWSAIDIREKAADLTSILAIIGSVFALLSRYAVFVSAQGLHQGSTLSVYKTQPVASVFLHPLLASITGFLLLFIALVLLHTRNYIWAEKIRAAKIREAL